LLNILGLRVTAEPRQTLLASDAGSAPETGSSRRLNALAVASNASAYLEVGIREGKTFQAVKVASRTGVDPEHNVDINRLPPGVAIFTMTSDEFFVNTPTEKKFDLIFLDGLHEFRQTYRDAVNAFARLSAQGLVLIDDVVPSSLSAASRDFATAMSAGASAGVAFPDWMGDVYLAGLALATRHPEVVVRTIVGDGHRPQMLAWLAEATHPPTELVDEDLSKLETRSYTDVFSSGIPAVFQARDLGVVLAEVRARKT
jgi:hypothetical protein